MSQDQIKNLLIIMNMRFYARIMWRNDEKWWRNQWQYHANSWWIAWKLLQIKAKQWDGWFWREKVICAKRFTKEVTLGTKNDVESKNYVVKASKHEKLEKYKFGSEQTAKSSKTIHKTIKHDVTMDFVQRMKKKDWKLIERGNFEVCSGSTHDAVFFVLQCFDLLYFGRWTFSWSICFINTFMPQ